MTEGRWELEEKRVFFFMIDPSVRARFGGRSSVAGSRCVDLRPVSPIDLLGFLSFGAISELLFPNLRTRP